MKTANVDDGDDDDDDDDDDGDGDDDELYLKGPEIPRTPAILPIILVILEPPPPSRSSQGKGIRDCLYYLHKYKSVINLRIF